MACGTSSRQLLTAHSNIAATTTMIHTVATLINGTQIIIKTGAVSADRTD